MDATIKDEFSWEPYVWRGTLGGVIGNIVFILLGAVFTTMRFGANYLNDVLIIGGIFSLLGGALTGLAIGFVIYKIAQRRGKQPDGVARFVIGSASFFLFLSLGLSELNLSHVVFRFAHAIFAGGLAGLMARAKHHPTSVSMTQDAPSSWQ